MEKEGPHRCCFLVKCAKEQLSQKPRTEDCFWCSQSERNWQILWTFLVSTFDKIQVDLLLFSYIAAARIFPYSVLILLQPVYSRIQSIYGKTLQVMSITCSVCQAEWFKAEACHKIQENLLMEVFFAGKSLFFFHAKVCKLLILLFH